MNQFLTFLEYFLTKAKKYKINEIVYPLVLYPIISSISLILTQQYVQSVTFYNIVVPYVYILFVGNLFMDFFFWLCSVLEDLLIPEKVKNLHLFNKFEFFLAGIVYTIMFYSIEVAVMYLIFFLAYRLSVGFLVLTLLGLFLVIPFCIAINLFLMSLYLKYKKDASVMWWLVSASSGILFLTTFSILALPVKIRPLLEVLIPSTAVVEEIRKLIILNKFDFGIITWLSYLLFCI